MSGVTGANRVRSRADFAQFVDEFREVISNFPGFVDMTTSGSYNSDLTKSSFGDIDLIIHFSWDDKKILKQMLVKYFERMSEKVIVPFTSERHFGKRTSNTGELVSVRYHSKKLGYSVQIDNIVALSAQEMEFKRQFLDMPAEKQGLVLGLIKVAAIETDQVDYFDILEISKFLMPTTPGVNEFEFSLSSSKLELRYVHYKPGTTEQLQHDIYWTSQDWNDVKNLLCQYDLDKPFGELLIDVKNTIRNPRSAKRIMGLFKSMVSVKSGEVGTPKGEIKEKALTQVALCLTQ